MKKQILTIFALLLLAFVPLTFAIDPEEETPIYCTPGQWECRDFYTMSCVNGQFFMPSLVVGNCGVQCLSNSDCGEGLTCHVVKCVVTPENGQPKPTPVAVQSRSSKNHWSNECNLVNRDTCKLRVKIHGMRKVADISYNQKEYTLTYDGYTKGVMWYNRFVPWRIKDPRVTVKDGNKTVFNEVVDKGDILFGNVEVTNVDYNGVFLWLTLEDESV